MTKSNELLPWPRPVILRAVCKTCGSGFIENHPSVGHCQTCGPTYIVDAETGIRNWTMGPEGHFNTSEMFLEIVGSVAEVMKSHRLGDNVESMARLIVAHLAHQHGLAPRLVDHKPPSIKSVHMNNLEDDVKKLLGMFPYNDSANSCWNDAYFAQSLRVKYGEEAVRKMEEKLRQEKRQP